MQLEMRIPNFLTKHILYITAKTQGITIIQLLPGHSEDDYLFVETADEGLEGEADLILFIINLQESKIGLEHIYPDVKPDRFKIQIIGMSFDTDSYLKTLLHRIDLAGGDFVSVKTSENEVRGDLDGTD